MGAISDNMLTITTPGGREIAVPESVYDTWRTFLSWVPHSFWRHINAEPLDCVKFDAEMRWAIVAFHVRDEWLEIALMPGTPHGDDSYLGAVVLRTANNIYCTQESLADGPFCYETWVEVLCSILAYLGAETAKCFPTAITVVSDREMTIRRWSKRWADHVRSHADGQKAAKASVESVRAASVSEKVQDAG